MIVFPNCKINLGLSILGKRADGFHDLETCFYPLPLTDVLEIIPARSDDPFNAPSPLFSASGLTVAGDPQQNLSVKAYHLLKEGFPLLPPIKMHLHKLIPMGAGLGGGSADGAFTLRLLNDLFDLQLTANQLIQYASRLGSDCPFFVVNKPCLAKGRGEILEETNLNLEEYGFLVVCPDIHVNTGWAFSQLSPQLPLNHPMPVQEAIRQPLETWKEILVNDFEKPVFQQFPEIREIKDRLYEQGALYASMSGSGSSLFGIFNRGQKPDPAAWEGYTTYFM
ncbi:MAG: 4-(cytidine 5'-diphospho)-2-C-methyl-D-erythritol kinase [Williamsia sp.]|nr:4-(cytidine 5'-diphospho)-2-C-methyl-D-erythritol kinase [Williamsia sp.]